MNATWYPQRIFQPPKWLVLGVNNTCNLHCKMCDVGVNFTQSNFFENLMGSRPLHMPFELFRTIVDQAHGYFPKVKLGFAFTEPLIYTHLDEALRYCSSKKVFSSITTNGLGLKKWAPLIHEVNVGELNISLDGPPEIHNYIRGNPHSFSMAIEGVEALQRLKSKVPVNVYCVITEWNAGALREFLNLLSPYGIRRVGLMHANFTPRHIAETHNAVFGGIYPATVSNISDTSNEAMDTGSLWDEIMAIKRTSWKFEVEFFPDVSSRADLERYYKMPASFIGRRCMDIFSNLMIKSNGDVIPAHGRCFNLTVGNLYKQDLKAIWNSHIISQFRTTVSRNGGLLPACSRCCSSFVK
jgi:MoaA/NifB/PqqE/SkfB family radical SAM enzyme